MTAHMLNLHLHENIEDDYYISSFFPADVQQHLRPLVEHRIKLILKQTVTFHAGDSQNVETSCILDDRKTRIKLFFNLETI